MIIKLQGMCLVLTILVVRAQPPSRQNEEPREKKESEKCSLQRTNFSSALSWVFSQVNIELLHLIYTQEGNYINQANDIIKILNNLSVKQIHISSFIQYERHLATHLPEVVTLSNIEQMRSRLFFLIVGSDKYTNRLLKSAKRMDKIYGWDLLLQNLALWMIVTSLDHTTKDTERILFHNTLVFTDMYVTPVNITAVTSHRNGHYVQSIGGHASDKQFAIHTGGLNGKQLTVAAMEWSPFTIDRKSNRTLDFVGISKNVLDGLANTFNFTYRFVIPEDGLWGSVDEHGNWSGVVGMLQRKEADVCISPYSSTEERNKVMSYGYFFVYQEIVVVYKQPKASHDQWTVLIFGFKPEVYLFGFLALAAITVLFLVLHLFRRLKHSESTESMSVFIADVVMSVWGVPLSQMDAPLFAPVASIRVLTFSWWLFCIIMVSVYTGNLIASFTVSREVTPFTSLEELTVNEEFEVDVVGGIQMEIILETSEMKTFKAIWQRIRQTRESQPSLKSTEYFIYQKQRVLSGSYALIAPAKIAEDLVNGDCDVRVMKKKIIPIYSSFVFPLDSPLAKIFELQMKHMVEAGLVEKWKRHWSPRKKICFDAAQFNNTPIYISEIITAIVAASGGITLAVITLVGERGYLCLKRKC